VRERKRLNAKAVKRESGACLIATISGMKFLLLKYSKYNNTKREYKKNIALPIIAL